MLSFFNKFNNHSVAKLDGHTGAVMSLALSPNRKLLASGGADGIKVWNMKTYDELSIPQQPFHARAQVSCTAWITRKNEAFDTLCYGNALGWLVFLQHRPNEGRFEIIYLARIAKGGEVLSIAVDTSGGSSTRVATGTRDNCVLVWTFDSSSRKLQSLHGGSYGDGKDIVPKGLAFTENTTKDLHVFGLHDGAVHTYGGNDGKWINTVKLGSKIGNAAVDLQRGLCVVDNVGNGFDLYKLDRGEFIRTFVTKDPHKTYPKGVCFASDSRIVIAGSDHGLVYIFDRKSGRCLDTLRHSNEGGMQTITAIDGNGMTTIVSASASSCAATPILVWTWKHPATTAERASTNGWTTTAMFDVLVRSLMLVAAMAHVYGMMKTHFDTTFPVPIVGWPLALMSRRDTRAPEAPIKALHRIRLQEVEMRQPERSRLRNREYTANLADPRREMVEQIIEMIAEKRMMTVNDVSQPPEEQKRDVIIL